MVLLYRQWSYQHTIHWARDTHSTFLNTNKNGPNFPKYTITFFLFFLLKLCYFIWSQENNWCKKHRRGATGKDKVVHQICLTFFVVDINQCLFHIIIKPTISFCFLSLCLYLLESSPTWLYLFIMSVHLYQFRYFIYDTCISNSFEAILH